MNLSEPDSELIGSDRVGHNNLECLETLVQIKTDVLEFDSSQPVLILATGVESGARELVACLSSSISFWEEPYGPRDFLGPIWKTVCSHVRSHGSKGVSRKDATRLRTRLQRFLVQLFTPSVAHPNDARWGISDWRWSVTDARLLNWIFPKLKVVAILRSPIDSYEAYFRSGVMVERSGGSALTVSAFAKHWQRQANDFATPPAGLGLRTLRFESLNEIETLHDLKDYFEVDTLNPLPSADSKQNQSQRKVPTSHLRILDQYTGAPSRNWGFEPANIPRIELPTSIEGWEKHCTPLFSTYIREDRRSVAFIRMMGMQSPQFESSLRCLELAGIRVRRLTGASAIDTGRSSSVCQALEDGFEHIFWIDSNLSFELSDLEKLQSLRRPIVGGLLNSSSSSPFDFEPMEQQSNSLDAATRCPIQVRRTSCSFLYTHRVAFDTLAPTSELALCNQKTANGLGFIPYFKPMIVDGHLNPLYLADNFAFTERAFQAGIPIFIHADVRPGRYEFMLRPFGA